MMRAWPLDVSLPDAESPLRERLRHLLGFARLAPSLRNRQPWRFGLADDAVEVVADRSRGLAVADPDGRGLTLSCGAALAFVEIAAHAAGLATAIERLPDAENPDLLARLTITGEARPATEEPWLFQAMPKRRTHRGVFSSHRVSHALVRRLIALADAHGAPLTILEGAERRALVELVDAADRAQRGDPGFCEELAAAVSPAADEGAGIPAHADELPAILAGARSRLRSFAWATGEDPEAPAIPATGETIDLGAPILAIMTTAGDDPTWWLRAGETLARVLLRGRVDHLWASFLGAPIEVASARAALRSRLCRGAWPQVVLRLGYAGDLSPTPRRPLEALVDER